MPGWTISRAMQADAQGTVPLDTVLHELVVADLNPKLSR